MISFTAIYKGIILDSSSVINGGIRHLTPLFMLDQLFGSKTRVALLKLFFENPDRAYFVRELTREIEAQINSVRRELDNLVKLGIVQVTDNPVVDVQEWEEVPKGLNRKKFYQLNRFFVLHDELSGLFSKSHLMHEKDLMNQLANLDAYLVVMTGKFTGNTDTIVDILLVGSFNKNKLNEIVGQFEKRLEREINYTTMTLKEFEYRQEITDRFLYDILVNEKQVLVDKIGLDQVPARGA